MKYKTIRVRPGDKAHLARLADERKCDMADVLDALVTEAEAGRIYKPLCKRKYGKRTVKITVPAKLGKRFNAVRDAWGVYGQQVVTWLLESADLVKRPNPMDTWAWMEANRAEYERVIAEAMK